MNTDDLRVAIANLLVAYEKEHDKVLGCFLWEDVLYEYDGEKMQPRNARIDLVPLPEAE